VFLGYGSDTNETLDLGGNSLAITGSLFIGQSSGTGTLSEGVARSRPQVRMSTAATR